MVRGMSAPDPLSPARRLWLPAPVLPLAYFAGAHLSLLVGCVILVLAPATAGAFHYHPRMIALTHLLTLGWVTGSILGALYIVGPLALGCPMPVRRADVLAAVAFWAGTAGMVTGFWTGQYAWVGLSALAVLVALIGVCVRLTLGLWTARVPRGVTMHIVLAFANIVGAGGLGIYMALTRGTAHAVSPIAMAAAHAHLATIGWAVMMIVGVAYRLVPMFLPAAMPSSRTLVWSAVLLEAGALGTAWGLAVGRDTTFAAAAVAGGLVVFSLQIRRTLRERRPRPAAMRGRDWATWQTHAALACLPLALGLGVWISWQPAPTPWTWVYGVVALLGCVAQMVVGVQGRLLPMHAWYIAMRRRQGGQPALSVHALYEAPVAGVIFALWTLALIALAVGLAWQAHAVVSGGAAALGFALCVQVGYGIRMVSRACSPAPMATS